MDMRHFINTVSQPSAAPLTESVRAPAAGFSLWRLLEGQKKTKMLERKKATPPRRK
jgi:hypothetical protein